ncbi:hypothetical protein CSW00_28090 [Pseudomonas asiatica]|nr:hypothetical protein CSW00_28090 [Pseudomonas sp. MR 02]
MVIFFFICLFLLALLMLLFALYLAQLDAAFHSANVSREIDWYKQLAHTAYLEQVSFLGLPVNQRFKYLLVGGIHQGLELVAAIARNRNRCG